jgi:hypothetical protein
MLSSVGSTYDANDDGRSPCRCRAGAPGSVVLADEDGCGPGADGSERDVVEEPVDGLVLVRVGPPLPFPVSVGDTDAHPSDGQVRVRAWVTGPRHTCSMRWDDLQLLRRVDELEQAGNTASLNGGLSLLQEMGGPGIAWDREAPVFARELNLAREGGYLTWKDQTGRFVNNPSASIEVQYWIQQIWEIRLTLAGPRSCPRPGYSAPPPGPGRGRRSTHHRHDPGRGRAVDR